MKLKFLVLLCLTFLSLSGIYAQNVTWAKHIGGLGTDQAQSVAVDDSGNVYLAGSFSGITDFDPGPGILNLTSMASPDIFIQKLDGNGNLVWVKQIGNSGQNYGMKLVLDAQANVYITGSFYGTTDFDPGPGVSLLTATGTGSNRFVLKLSSTGTFLWARNTGAPLNFGYDIAVDPLGNVYTTGEFLATVDFDPGPGNFNLTASGAADIFVHKMDANGNFVWVKQIGGPGFNVAHGLELDASGNIYIAGQFTETTDFDPGTGVSNLVANGTIDAFILKLDASGNYIWARQVGGSEFDVAYGLDIDAFGNVLVSGNFRGSVDFDPGPAVFNLSSAGDYDVFILKLNNNGHFLWAKKVGGPSIDQSFSLVTDATGNVYVSGEFRQTANFNQGNPAANLTSSGYSDAFMMKLDPNGNFIRVKKIGGTGIDYYTSMVLDTADNIYSVGLFENTIYFFLGSGSVFFTSSGGRDVFVQKQSQCSTTPAVDVKTACNSYTWIDGNTYTVSNNTATFTLLNAAGCDSVITLNLTINATSSIDTITTCSSYTWIDGNTYTTSNNTATHTLTNAAGCDSVITLNLTIGANAGIDTVVACNSYTWIDGTTYTASNNTATHTLTNIAGCDSVVTLNLTINTVADLSTSLAGATISANNTNATAYQWLDCNNNYSALINETGISFTAVANGSYAVAITENGCTDTSACVSINTLSIDGAENGIKIISYPNPSDENVYISLGQEMKNVRLTLMSTDGKVLYSKLYKSLSNTVLSLGAYSGVYFLNIEAEKVKRTIRLLRE